MTYFDQKQEINRTDFIRLFDVHINKREEENRLDVNELKTKELLQLHVDKFVFYTVLLNEQGFHNLVLPQHAVELESGNSPDRAVKVGGEKLNKVVNDYANMFIPNNRFPRGTQKILKQRERFFQPNDRIVEADFLWVSNNRDYAHPNADGQHYDSSHGADSIFMGNGFHRFVAYGLFIVENGFRPIRLHFADFKG